MPNRLAQETSPYLRQHMNNPVDWYPWGDEALGRSRTENKPILLSIGYSACHWCHVMERESFEDADIAARMNEHYVCIKVDREERPDLDHIYQMVAQAMTQSGGWPLTVFLTPDLKPFFGGTYFPPGDRYGRPGFGRVLSALARAFRDDRESVNGNAEKLLETIRGMDDDRGGGGSASRGLGLAVESAERLLSAVDLTGGGFGGAPKFPNTMSFTALWRVGRVTGRSELTDAAALTLEAMARGGIYDQLGGGFHRYSVDATWSVPHFEKMLYDNGLLLKLYAEVLLARGVELPGERRRVLRDAVAGTVEYLLREMISPDGLFYAAQDADSEGVEGKFFSWTPAQLAELKKAGKLTAQESAAFQAFYDVTVEGNFEHGQTILYQALTYAELAARLKCGAAEAEGRLSSARSKLLAERTLRVAPATDTKQLAGWNGLAIGGLAWASLALRAEKMPELADRALAAAQAAFRAVRGRLAKPDETGRLFGTLQEGQPKLNAYLDDYAFLAWGALDLARALPSDEGRAELQDAAGEWAETVLGQFATPDGRGYFFTSHDHETLVHRPRGLQDSAIPAGSSVMMEVLTVLEELDWRGRAADFAAERERQLTALRPALARNPHGQGELLLAELLQARGPIVISGPDARELVNDGQVFVKPGDTRVLCQAKTCVGPFADLKAAQAELERRLRPQR